MDFFFEQERGPEGPRCCFISQQVVHSTFTNRPRTNRKTQTGPCFSQRGPQQPDKKRNRVPDGCNFAIAGDFATWDGGDSMAPRHRRHGEDELPPFMHLGCEEEEGRPLASMCSGMMEPTGRRTPQLAPKPFQSSHRSIALPRSGSPSLPLFMLATMTTPQIREDAADLQNQEPGTKRALLVEQSVARTSASTGRRPAMPKA